MKSYIDELDTNILPFVDYEGYADRYPALSAQSFSADFYDEIRHASRMLFQIFVRRIGMTKPPVKLGVSKIS